MNNSFTGKVALITGAVGGIGRSAAKAFAKAGYKIAITDREDEPLQAIKSGLELEMGAAVLARAEDLSIETSWQDLTNDVLSEWGRIDVLVNNAAWRTVESMRSISLENWEKTIRICLTAPAFLARYVAEAMEKNGKGGAIINLSSAMAQRAAGYSPAYIACKGGLQSLTYELASLYGPKGIRVVCINPGNVETEMSADYFDAEGNNVSKLLTADMDLHTPLRRAASADEIASVICWLASSEASFITGTSILADGGFTHNFNSYLMKQLQFPDTF